MGNTEITQIVTITGCDKDGTVRIDVNSSSTLDLANNNNVETSSTTSIVDNTAPKISIASAVVYDKYNVPGETNVAHFNNTHANRYHTVVYTITITDDNLLSNTTISSSNNYNTNPKVLLVKTEFEISGTTNGCTLSIDTPTTGDSLKQITQTLTMTGCNGNGKVSVKAKIGSTLDLANNNNAVRESSNEIIVDNDTETPLDDEQNLVSISSPVIKKSNGTNHYNNTHANKTHTIVYTITIEDTNLLSHTTIAQSTNYAAGVLLTVDDLEFVPAKTGDAAGCEMKISTPTSGTTTKITQVLEVTKCSVVTGTIKIRVKARTTVDLAHNYNIAVESVSVDIDNTQPIVSLELISNSNLSSNAKNNSHLSQSHELVIKATIKDHSLLDSETISNSTNYSSGLILSTDSGDVVLSLSTCTVSIAGPVLEAYDPDIEDGLDVFTQLITISSCTGNGSLSVKVKESATIDLMDNVNEESNILYFVVDNTAPTITISNPTIYEGDGNSIYSASDLAHYNSTHMNSSHKLVYTITITDTDTNLLDDETITDSTNKDNVLITKDEITVLGTATSDCKVLITVPTKGTISNKITSFHKTALGVDMSEFHVYKTITQVVTVTGCSGNGTVGIQVNEEATYDLADNNNAEKQTATGQYVTADNIAPTITISDPKVYEGTGSGQYAIGDKAHYNDTHGNKNHKIVYTITIEDTNLLAVTTIASSSNAAEAATPLRTGVLLKLGEITLTGTTEATAGCVAYITTPESGDSTTKITQVLTITGCTGDGNVGFSVNAQGTIDLAHNFNIATASTKNVRVDNTAPTVSLEFYSNSNNTEGSATNNTHISSEHTVIYKATISDSYLLDNTTATASSNYNETVHKIGVELKIAEITANVYNSSDEITGSCTIQVGEIINGSSKTSFYQLITLTNCTGEGRLKVVVKGGATKYDTDSSTDGNEEATLDLAGNCNTPNTVLIGVIVDNTPPEVVINLESNSNLSSLATNNSHASSGHTLVFVATITDLNLLDSDVVSSSSNYDAVILKSTEIFVRLAGGTTNTCTVTLGNPYDVAYYADIDNKDSFKQKITLTNCQGNGIATIKVLEDATVDLIEHTNEESNSLNFVVDNTSPTITIGNPTTSNTLTQSTHTANGTTNHVMSNSTTNVVSSAHTIQYVITITDTNLLDTSTIANSTNYAAGVLLTRSEITLIGTATSGCDWEVTTPVSGSGSSTITSFYKTAVGTSMSQITILTTIVQTVTVSGCSGNGFVGIQVNANATIDLADNKNAQQQTTNNQYVRVDNTRPTISIALSGTSNPLNDTHMSSSHTATFTVAIEDAELNTTNKTINGTVMTVTSYLHTPLKTGTTTGTYTNGAGNSEIKLINTGTVQCTSIVITTVSTTSTKIVQTIVVSGCTGDGTMTIKAIPGSDIKDEADNDILETTTTFTISGSNINDNNGRTVATKDANNNFALYSGIPTPINYIYKNNEIYNYKNNITTNSTWSKVSDVSSSKFTLAVVVDNTKPVIAITNPQIYDAYSSESHDDDKYTNNTKFVEFLLTMSDLYLLDINDGRTHISETINTIAGQADTFDNVNPELTFKLNGTAFTCTYVTAFTGSKSACEYTISTYTDPSKAADGVISFTQKVVMTGIQGDGLLQFIVNANVVNDMANNMNNQVSTSNTKSNADTVIIDNTAPTVTGSGSLDVFVGDPVKSIEEITAYYTMLATDPADVNGCYSGFWDTARTNSNTDCGTVAYANRFNTMGEGKYLSFYATSSVSSNGNDLWDNNYYTVMEPHIRNDNGVDIYYTQGTYQLTFNAVDDVGNRSAALTVEIVVKPRRLSVTYLPAEKVYDGTNVSFSSPALYHIEGLVYTDVVSSVAYTINGANANGSVVNAGTYTIAPTGVTLSSGSLTNYSLFLYEGEYDLLNKEIVLANNEYTKIYDSEAFYFDNPDQYTYNGTQFTISNTYTFDSVTSPTVLKRGTTTISSVTTTTGVIAIESNRFQISSVEYSLFITNNVVVSIRTNTHSIEVFGGNTFYISGIKYVINAAKTEITEYTYQFNISNVAYKIGYTDNVATKIIRINDGVVVADISGLSFTMAVPYVLVYNEETGSITKVINRSLRNDAATVTNNEFTIHELTYKINYQVRTLISILDTNGKTAFTVTSDGRFSYSGIKFVVSTSGIFTDGGSKVTDIENEEFNFFGNRYFLNYDKVDTNGKAISISTGSTTVYTLNDFISGQSLGCVSYTISGSSTYHSGKNCGSSNQNGMIIAGTNEVIPTSFVVNNGAYENYNLVAIEKHSVLNKKDIYIYYNGAVKIYDGITMSFAVGANGYDYTITNLQNNDDIPVINYTIDGSSANGTVRNVKMASGNPDANGYRITISSIEIKNSILSNLDVTSLAYNVHVNKDSSGTGIITYYRIDQVPLTIGFKDSENHRDYDSTTTGNDRFSNPDLYNIKGNTNSVCSSKVATIMYTDSSNCEYISAVSYAINGTTTGTVQNVSSNSVTIKGFTVAGSNTVATNYRFVNQSSYRMTTEYTLDGSQTTISINSINYDVIYKNVRVISVSMTSGNTYTVSNNVFAVGGGDGCEYYVINGNQLLCGDVLISNISDNTFYIGALAGTLTWEKQAIAVSYNGAIQAYVSDNKFNLIEDFVLTSTQVKNIEGDILGTINSSSSTVTVNSKTFTINKTKVLKNITNSDGDIIAWVNSFVMSDKATSTSLSVDNKKYFNVIDVYGNLLYTITLDGDGLMSNITVPTGKGMVVRNISSVVGNIQTFDIYKEFTLSDHSIGITTVGETKYESYVIDGMTYYVDDGQLKNTKGEVVSTVSGGKVILSTTYTLNYQDIRTSVSGDSKSSPIYFSTQQYDIHQKYISIEHLAVQEKQFDATLELYASNNGTAKITCDFSIKQDKKEIIKNCTTLNTQVNNENVKIAWVVNSTGYADLNINDGIIVTLNSPSISNGTGSASNYTIGTQTEAMANIIKRILSNEITEGQKIYSKYVDNNIIVYAGSSLINTGFGNGKLTLAWAQHNEGFVDASIANNKVITLNVDNFIIYDGQGDNGTGLWSNYELDSERTTYTFIADIKEDTAVYELSSDQIVLEQYTGTEWIRYNDTVIGYQDTGWTNLPIRVRILENVYKVTEETATTFKFTVNGKTYVLSKVDQSYSHNTEVSGVITNVSTSISRLEISETGTSTLVEQSCGVETVYICNNIININNVKYTIIFDSTNGKPIEVVKEGTDKSSNWWYEFSYVQGQNDREWKQYYEYLSENTANKNLNNRGVDTNSVTRTNWTTTGVRLENINESLWSYLRIRKINTSTNTADTTEYTYTTNIIKYDTTLPVIKIERVDQTDTVLKASGINTYMHSFVQNNAEIVNQNFVNFRVSMIEKNLDHFQLTAANIHQIGDNLGQACDVTLSEKITTANGYGSDGYFVVTLTCAVGSGNIGIKVDPNIAYDYSHNGYMATGEVAPNYNLEQSSVLSTDAHIVDHKIPGISSNLVDVNNVIDTNINYIKNTTGSYVKLTMTDTDSITTGISYLNYYRYIVIPGVENAIISELEYTISGDELKYGEYFVANIGKTFDLFGKTYVICDDGIKYPNSTQVVPNSKKEGNVITLKLGEVETNFTISSNQLIYKGNGFDQVVATIYNNQFKVYGKTYTIDAANGAIIYTGNNVATIVNNKFKLALKANQEYAINYVGGAAVSIVVDKYTVAEVTNNEFSINGVGYKISGGYLQNTSGTNVATIVGNKFTMLFDEVEVLLNSTYESGTLTSKEVYLGCNETCGSGKEIFTSTSTVLVSVYDHAYNRSHDIDASLTSNRYHLINIKVEKVDDIAVELWQSNYEWVNGESINIQSTIKISDNYANNTSARSTGIKSVTFVACESGSTLSGCRVNDYYGFIGNISSTASFTYDRDVNGNGPLEVYPQVTPDHNSTLT